MPHLKYFTTGFVGVITAILTTGALLNLAGKGTLGATAQKFAKAVTNGYGDNA